MNLVCDFFILHSNCVVKVDLVKLAETWKKELILKSASLNNKSDKTDFF